MKLYVHNVVVPFDYASGFSDQADQNHAIRAWWRDRRHWLSERGIERYHAYRVGTAYTCVVDGREPPPGNNNIDNVVLWSFQDGDAAVMFKLTWGGQ